ncbi:DNA damage-regulated autophagy modulator protein 1-like [Lycorma delicatula]|uniref:DNA damage-regulated autophagy modulator protein 1-like n=1 Tax=Lycorma delicatula TaxID=130591 RepID=UPI003F5142F3
MAPVTSRLHWLPVIIFLWIPFSFITSYLIAVGQDHVYPFFPAISDTGTIPPESCFFGFLVNLLALLLAFAVWLRGKQLRELNSVSPGVGPGSIGNNISCIIGYLSCFGLYIVANCQELNALLLHIVGAFLTFWAAFLYSVLQTVFSFWLIGELNSKVMFLIRFILCCLQIVFNFLSPYAFFISIKQFRDSGRHGLGSTLKWKPDDPGWTWHLVAAVSEWLLTITIGFFILTFRSDFQTIYLKPPQVTLKSFPDYSQRNGNTSSRKLDNHVDQPVRF